MNSKLNILEKLMSIPSAEDIARTHIAIKDWVHRTPVLSSKGINEMTKAQIFFKCENFQKVGAFKMRGASRAVLSLSLHERSKGVGTHSSGNHAQAVALAAKIMGIKARVVMPENSPEVKKKATEGYGAEITFCTPTLEARESTLNALIKEYGIYPIHPYNDYNIIAGQATAAKEFLEDCPGMNIIMGPVGGGGLMSGTCLSSLYFQKGIRVIGAEPEAVNDAYRSFNSGKLELNTSTNTIADGLKTNLGEKTFEIIVKYLDDIITVSEDSIVIAMKIIWERMKILVEPSSAVPFAAILNNPALFEGKKVGIILSGGNVDLGKLPF